MFLQQYAKTTALAILLLLLPLGSPAVAEINNEHKIKAAIVFKLLRYISWPAEVSSSETITLCVDQNDPYFAAFSDVAGRFVRSQEIVLENLPAKSLVGTCQIVFTSSHSAELEHSLTTKAVNGVLTISDSSQFAERGGMIHLLVKNNRVRFKINPHAAYQSNIRINSSLLRLADIVETVRQQKIPAHNLHVNSGAYP